MKDVHPTTKQPTPGGIKAWDEKVAEMKEKWGPKGERWSTIVAIAGWLSLSNKMIEHCHCWSEVEVVVGGDMVTAYAGRLLSAVFPPGRYTEAREDVVALCDIVTAEQNDADMQESVPKGATLQ